MPEAQFSCPYCLSVLQATAVTRKYETYLCAGCQKVFHLNPAENKLYVSELTVAGIPGSRSKEERQA